MVADDGQLERLTRKSIDLIYKIGQMGRVRAQYGMLLFSASNSMGSVFGQGGQVPHQEFARSGGCDGLMGLAKMGPRDDVDVSTSSRC